MLCEKERLASLEMSSEKAAGHALIHSRAVNSESHNIVRICHTSVQKSHVMLNRTFRVIHGHPYWCQRNPERGVVVIHNNVGLISETYEDITTGKLQIRF